MATAARVRVTDDLGRSGLLLQHADGHLLGDELFEFSRQWRARVNDDDPEPERTAPQLVADLVAACGMRESVAQASTREWDYEVRIVANRVAEIIARHRRYDNVIFLEALRSGGDTDAAATHVEVWRIIIAPEAFL